MYFIDISKTKFLKEGMKIKAGQILLGGKLKRVD